MMVRIFLQQRSIIDAEHCGRMALCLASKVNVILPAYTCSSCLWTADWRDMNMYRIQLN